MILAHQPTFCRRQTSHTYFVSVGTVANLLRRLCIRKCRATKQICGHGLGMQSRERSVFRHCYYENWPWSFRNSFVLNTIGTGTPATSTGWLSIIVSMEHCSESDTGTLISFVKGSCLLRIIVRKNNTASISGIRTRDLQLVSNQDLEATQTA